MMTNGEKIKEIFPYLENDKRDLVKVLNIDNLKNWWNSEYQEPTNENDLGVEKIIDEMEKEFEKVDIPIMDKLTLFAKVQNALYKCAVSNSEIPNNSITKNDLGVDAVSRQAVLELIADYDLSMGQVVRGIHALPSVTPQEPKTFKWCETCKEYDQEKHCCHRWSTVIRDTVAEMKQEYIEREVLDDLRAEVETEKLEDSPNFCIKAHNNAVDRVLGIIDKYKTETEET